VLLFVPLRRLLQRRGSRLAECVDDTCHDRLRRWVRG
jgi:hypothetical protein